MSLGANGVDWVHSLRKIPTRLRGTNFCINCSSSPYFASSFMELRNDPKCTQTLYNAPKHEFRVQLVDWVRLWWKIQTWLRVTNFCFNCTSTLCFASSFMQFQNDPKCTQTLCNAPKHEFRVQWGGLGPFVEKNPVVTSWHDFRINCTSSPCFSSSFMRLRNDPKCTLTLCNAPKHEFRVQWGGLGAFVAKNPDVASCHELLH